MQYSHERLMISVYDGALPGKGDSRANLYDSKRWNISGFGAPLGVEGSLSENKNLQWARSRYRVLLCDYITPYHSISYVAGSTPRHGIVMANTVGWQGNHHVSLFIVYTPCGEATTSSISAVRSYFPSSSFPSIESALSHYRPPSLNPYKELISSQPTSS